MLAHISGHSAALYFGIRAIQVTSKVRSIVMEGIFCAGGELSPYSRVLDPGSQARRLGTNMKNIAKTPTSGRILDYPSLRLLVLFRALVDHAGV